MQRPVLSTTGGLSSPRAAGFVSVDGEWAVEQTQGPGS